MYNLIQIQSALQGLPPDTVMKYANGKDPSVPSWLALGELNRRKQLEDTASEFYGEIPSVKDQITSSLTGAPQGVNPTAAPQGINPASIPPQLAPTIAAPPKMADPTEAPNELDPTAPPPMPMAAEGGLMSLPVDMFKQSNYAGGGIISFDQGGKTPNALPSRFSEDISKFTSGIGSSLDNIGDLLTAPVRAGVRYFSPRDRYEEQGIDTGSGQKVTTVTPTEQKPSSELVKPPVVTKPVVNNKQLSNTTSGQINNPVEKSDVAEIIPKTKKEKALADYFTENKELQRLAGVSDDPMKDIKERYAKIEAKRAAQEEDDPMNSFRAGLRAYANANPTDRAMSQFGKIGEGMAAYDKETIAMREKQALDMAGLQAAMAKEDDARKRGDVAGATSARKEQREYENKLAELGTQSRMASAAESNAASQMIKAGASVVSANAQAQHVKNEMAKIDATLKENPLVSILAKEWAGNIMLQKEYPQVLDFLSRQGLRPNAKISGSGTVMSMSDVARTAKESGKSQQQVIDAARAKGFTIQ
jgi:hypothetical protein